MTPEFSRVIDLRQIGDKPVRLVADEAERRRLAGRFALSGIDSLEADVELVPDGPVVTATGRLRAAVVQACAISGEDFPVTIDEPLFVRFVPAVRREVPDEEIELDADDLDEVEYEGTAFDLGEAVAQSLALAIDPFAEGPNAEAARKAAGLSDSSASGPFAALAALRRDD
jgi:uncharacterized metal-binding protein YceD (DUF177 family)